MYEILKQYERIGEVTFTVKELRGKIGIKDEEYPRWDKFKDKVLDVCQKALEKHTDIKYTYELIKKGGGGKTSPVVAVKFIIEHNTVPEQLSLLDPDVTDGATVEREPMNEYRDLGLKVLAEAFNFIFDDTQMQVIERLLRKFPGSHKGFTDQFSYLRDVCVQLNYRRNKKEKEGEPIEDDFAYVVGIIKKQLSDIQEKERISNEDD